jgi:hypothetical protein
METDMKYWLAAGKKDREIGNTSPGVTPEDFHREIEDARVAAGCAHAYALGFNGERVSTHDACPIHEEAYRICGCL